MNEEHVVREPAVAGMFYPEHPADLRKTVEGMLVDRRISPDEIPAGLIVPHAGYMYSGTTSGRAYSAIRSQRFDTVVVVAPSHREAFRGASVYSGDAYATPLGVVPVDAVHRQQLTKSLPLVHQSLAGHRDEHALEVQLPFLQVVLDDFSLLPIIMGEQTREVMVSLGDALGKIFEGRNVLMIASTDLSHYYPADTAEMIDRVTIGDIRDFAPERMIEHLERQTAEACGGGPAVAVMLALRHLGAVRMEIAHHCTSGDVTGDRHSVVGYCSAIAWKKRAA